MKIRSVTLGVDSKKINHDQKDILRFFAESGGIFEQYDISVRTNRLNLSPFVFGDSAVYRNMISLVNWISDFCLNNEIRWFCVPFTTSNQEMREINAFAIEIAKRHKNAFINYIVTQGGKIDRHAILHVSKFIKSVSRLSNNGYDNFRIGTSFNCLPNGPFFPFTFHQGQTGFSTALELVPLFIKVIKKCGAKDIEAVRKNLLKTIVPVLEKVEKICLDIEAKTGAVYYGIDASLAPFPDSDNNSVARVVELLGIDAFGSYGTVFLTSFLTDIIKTLSRDSGIKSIGFNGVMYSLLEDTRLGINSKSKEFSIDSMLAYSSVCGCGIDMVPVPGDVFEEEIASLMLDVAAISSVRRKPLGVRILPIPTKQANEFTEFSYDFLHNTRIKKIKNKTCFSHSFETKKLFTYLSETI